MRCSTSYPLCMASEAVNRYARFAATLDRLREKHCLRVIPDGFPEGCIDMTTNDYMGLAAEMQDTGYCLRAAEMTSSASRLLAGEQGDARELEALLSDLYGRPALLFNSGYHANTGCVSAIASGGMTIVADRLVHASIIDGMRLSGAPFKRFRHNDMEHLRRIVAQESAEGHQVLVVTESVFSMDGDVAPLAEMVQLRREHDNMLLYVDEAHAFGVRGARGLGVCEELGLLGDVDLLIGTFGKAAASMGAFAVASPVLHDYLVNTARSLIFSTALPPACFRHTSVMVRCLSEECAARRERLAELASLFRQGIERITGTPNMSTSQIVPLMVCDAGRVLNLSARLRTRGVLALPIRRPTVPPGTERIRFTVNASLRREDIEYVLDCISREL